MRHLVLCIVMAGFIAVAFDAASQQRDLSRPGLQPHVPTRIDWLTTVLQASLRSDITEESKFVLQITSPDSETILIYVRYLPNVNREGMNLHIDAAREVIRITSKSYGWDKWLKVREDIQLGKPDRR